MNDFKESQLKDSEERFRTTFEQAAVGIAHSDPEGRFIKINQKFCDIVGYTLEEMLTRTFQDITHPDDLDTDLEHARQLLNEEIKTYSREKRYFKKNGEVVWVNLTVSLVREDTGKPRYFIAVVEDIADRMQIKQALLNSEEKYRNLIEQANDGIVVLQEGRIRFVNSMMKKMFGYTSKEFLNAPFEKFIPADEFAKIADMYKRRMNKEDIPSIYESYILNKNGSLVEVEYNAKLSEYDGKPANLVIVRDITERKLAEQALKKEAEFQELVSRISTKFIDLPADKIDQAINDQFEEIGKFFNADRVTIASMSDKGEVLEASHMWFSDKIDVKELADHMKGATYPNFTDYIKTRTHWSFSNPDDFSHWHPEYETNEKTAFKSGLAINLNYDGFILEIFVIDVMHSNRVWTENTIVQVNLLGHVFSNALNRKRADEELRKNNEIQKLVSGIATKFSALTGAEFETAIHNTLGEVGKYFNSDTVRLYRLSLKGDVVKIRSMWRNERLAPPEEMPEIHKLKYPNLANHYSKGESVVFSKYDESPEWPEMRKILKFFGTKAGVGVPIEIDDEGVDIFAMDKVQSENIWPENIISQSKIIGGVILSAMQRRDVEIQLQEHFDEIKSLKDQLEKDNVYLLDEIKLNHNFEEIIGESSSLKYALHNVEKIAPVNTTVLLLGETGTGKELFARAIHNASPLKNRPVIKLNCATLPPDIIESELFGHEKGAFTGAHARQIGRFERADGTTIFLDEIGELPLALQPKLLRVLQDGEFERLGGSKTLKTNVRVIAATNRNLEEEVLTGRFRSDLYYRLKVFPITIPPLRKRIEDLPLLVKFLVKRISRKLGKEITEIPNKAIEVLQNYSWPGNVRELENVIEGAVINSSGKVLRIELPKARVLEEYEAKTLEDVERDHITKILKLSNWRIEGPKGAAVVLGMNPGTLRSRMQKLGIEKPK